jgi:hypothetical protein
MPIDFIEGRENKGKKMSLSIGGLSGTNALVSGNELEQVSKEIFGAASVGKPASTAQNVSQINLDRFNAVETGIRIFGDEANSDTQVARQIANNKAGLDVNLSKNTLAAIESLNAKAANLQMQDVSNRVSGKIHVYNEAPNFADTKSVFAINNATQLFGTDNLENNKKGSNPFLIKSLKKDDNKEEKLNLSI